jgi:hypothetical protein
MELQPLETDKIICVKVGKVARKNLYEMTRKYWVVKLERAKKSTHVLAIIKGIVEAVYIPIEWKHSEERIGRCEFIGYEDLNSDYIGKSVIDFYGKSQNPIKYINL